MGKNLGVDWPYDDSDTVNCFYILLMSSLFTVVVLKNLFDVAFYCIVDEQSIVPVAVVGQNVLVQQLKLSSVNICNEQTNRK